MRKNILIVFFVLVFVFGSVSLADAKTLGSRVNEAFRSVHSKNPNGVENIYWLGRVVRKEKTSYESLRGAMYFHKARGATMGGASSSGGVSISGTSSKPQMIKDVLPLFVQIYGGDPSNAEKAWWRKRISCNEIKTTKSLVSSMKYHKSKKARQGSANICGATASSSVASSGGVTRKSVAGISSHPYGNQVRIGIYKVGSGAISVTANSKFQVREGAFKVLSTLGKDDAVKVSWSGGKYHVRGSGISHDVAGKIRLVPLDMGIMKITSYNDKSTTIAGKNYNRFRGIIEIRKSDNSNDLWAINELRTEYYLRGLAETSGNGPVEYIKALGAAARTYVLYHKVVTGGRSVHNGYDIGKTSDDQIYRGYEYEVITPRMSSIFNSTKGIIITDSAKEKPVSSIYFSDSDGRTRTAKEKWGTDRFPHLQKSVADPHHVAGTCRGHCVGMSAQGAYGFANKDGWSFQKILKYYFTGVQLVKAY